MDDEFTPEFKAKLKAILDQPESTTEEMVTELQEVVGYLCDTCEKYEDAMAAVYRASLDLPMGYGSAIQGPIEKAVGGVEGVRNLLAQRD